MAWIELHQSLWTHRKTLILAGLLDIDETYAGAHIARLWTWALDNAPEGDITGLPGKVLAFAAGWRGDPTAFINALVDAGWIDAPDDGPTMLHDWEEYAGRLIEKRRTDADRLRRWRATQRTVMEATPERNADETHSKDAVTVPNRTSVVPNLTVPEEIKPKDTGVVVVVPTPNGATTATARHHETISFQQLSPGAQEVVTGWREALGKRAPPKLNPTQVAKLEAAVADLGVPRLLESAEWCAGKGLTEFPKTLSAAYTKRQRDEAEGYRNGSPNGASGHSSAIAKYDT